MVGSLQTLEIQVRWKNALCIRSYSTGLFDSQIVDIMVWQEQATCHYLSRPWLCSLPHTFATFKASRQMIKRIIAMVLIWHTYIICNRQPACILVCNIQWDKDYLEKDKQHNQFYHPVYIMTTLSYLAFFQDIFSHWYVLQCLFLFSHSCIGCYFRFHSFSELGCLQALVCNNWF